MKKELITIDGPAGVGKTTLAKNLASVLEIPYLNTGAMFRCLALELGEEALKLDAEQLITSGKNLEFSLAGKPAELFCNGLNPGDKIKGEKIAALASALAAKPEVREILRLAQRKLAETSPLVCEGRDMGTVVFPDAKFKFFLDADPAIRARRRWLELPENDRDDLENIERQIRLRDKQDRERPIAPLKAAEDAVIIDTSTLTIDEVQKLMLDHIQQKGGTELLLQKARIVN